MLLYHAFLTPSAADLSAAKLTPAAARNAGARAAAAVATLATAPPRARTADEGCPPRGREAGGAPRLA